jgi:segregation and condensation protein A
MASDFTVRLEHVFQGPLDLLLHLVKEQEVEIQDIEIARILEGYLAYLESLDRLDIEYAGDFLVMAATLMSIKSRSLLPNAQIDLATELDPRDELVQRLLEYRRFKGAADEFDQRQRLRGQQVPRGWKGLGEGAQERELELGELTVWDLLSTFSRLMREVSAGAPHRVSADPRPLRYYVAEVVGRLRGGRACTLRELVASFADHAPREALVGAFCALLELVRLELVELRQEARLDDIALALRADRADQVEDVLRTSLIDAGEPEAQADPPHGTEPSVRWDAADPDADEDELADYILPDVPGITTDSRI